MVRHASRLFGKWPAIPLSARDGPSDNLLPVEADGVRPYLGACHALLQEIASLRLQLQSFNYRNWMLI